MVFSTKILNLKLASPRSNQSAKNKQTFQSKIVLISLKLLLFSSSLSTQYTGLKEGIRNSTLHCSNPYGPMSSTRALI